MRVINKVLIILFLVVASYGLAQEKIQFSVLDKHNGVPLAYCNVIIKKTNAGGITNIDGKVILRIKRNDTLVFSYLGYKRNEISCKHLSAKETIYLDKINYELNEVVISANNDYLYDILEKCRNKMLMDKTKQISKTYYTVETRANDTILEFLECYYNSAFTGIKLNELMFKQGRFGLSTVEGNYFVTMNTSKAIADINLLKNIGYFPFIPTQLKKRKLKKYFDLNLIGSTDEYYKVAFKPKEYVGFSGSIFIHKKNFNIIGLSLNIEDTFTHPFISLYPSSSDKLSKLTLSVNYLFDIIDNRSFISLIDFEYSFNYLSDRSKQIPPKKVERIIDSKSTLYFYDFNSPFILPYFDFDNNIGDYFSIASIPYNDVFWDYQDSQILPSEEQKKGLDYLVANGNLVNYKKLDEKEMGLSGQGSQETFFVSEYAHWSKNKRVIVSSDIRTSFNENETEHNQHAFNLMTQILLDITDCEDSLHCRSYTVFDIPNSYYYFPQDSISNAFINIYFDICEVERRKMQAQINSGNLPLSQIDSIYNQVILDIDTKTSHYLKDVERGQNKVSLEKWNQYVIDELGIDNIRMSIVSWEEKQKNMLE